MTGYGSVWAKWDLHLHAPGTAMADNFSGVNDDEKWERYLTALEALEGFAVLGITDYLGVAGFRRANEAKLAGRLSNIAFLMPNIEFRVTPVTGNEKALNMHLLVCPSIVEELDSILFNRLTMRYANNTYSASTGDLIRLGREFTRDDRLEDEAARRKGVEQFKFDFTQLHGVLSMNAILRQKSLCAVAQSSNDGASGLQASGLLALRQEVYRQSQVVFSGRDADREYFLGHGVDNTEEVIRQYGSLKPCVHGSDAHALEQIGNPAMNRFTWIKADPTFEGLRQIVFEPESRVALGEQMPPRPIHLLKKAKVTVPDGTVLSANAQAEPFCYRGETHAGFAAGLTCVIGGRGAGKSTLLNLLHEHCQPGENQFWKQYQLRNTLGETLDVADCVTPEYIGDASMVEFISQNEIEALALAPATLTTAIRKRFQIMDDTGHLESAMTALSRERDDCRRRMKLLGEKSDATLELRKLRAALISTRALIESFADPLYTEAAAELDAMVLECATVETERLALGRFLQQLETAVTEAEATDAKVSEYAAFLSDAIRRVKELLERTKAAVDCEMPGAREVELAGKTEQKRDTIRDFLQQRGLSMDNVRDVEVASARSGQLAAEIAAKEAESERLSVALQRNVQLLERRASVEEELRALTAKVNAEFTGGAAEARRVELRYRYDVDAAKEVSVEWLVDAVGREFPDARVRSDFIGNVLASGGDILTAPLADIVDAVRRDKSKSGQLLDAYFGAGANAEIWDVVRQLANADIDGCGRIEIFYDGKPLEQTSFGQRCSAVLIVLLSLGNRPIVVDEPEAHLDSALIADYLVDLVKRVKRHRQVVFATHNANFVVNGDAELVIALAQNADGRTKLQNVTIENLEARPLLLALEGGAKAFVQREGRYAISET